MKQQSLNLDPASQRHLDVVELLHQALFLLQAPPAPSAPAQQHEPIEKWQRPGDYLMSIGRWLPRPEFLQYQQQLYAMAEEDGLKISNGRFPIYYLRKALQLIDQQAQKKSRQLSDTVF